MEKLGQKVSSVDKGGHSRAVVPGTPKTASEASCVLLKNEIPCLTFEYSDSVDLS